MGKNSRIEFDVSEIHPLVGEWTKHRFNFRSGYYAGRGPNPGDLDSKILEMFHQGIKKQVGDEAAKNFVRFVNKLEDLSASSFIVAFEKFWVGKCTVIDISQRSSDRVQLSGHGRQLEGEAFGTIMAAFSGGLKSEEETKMMSRSIKADFLRAHAKEIPEAELAKPCSSHRYR